MTANPNTYSVEITMSDVTVNALTLSQYYLYVLKGVQSSDAANIPLIWLRTQTYSRQTTLSWSDQHEAYTSRTTSPVDPGERVDVGFSVPIAVGEILTVTQLSGSGEVTTNGIAGAITTQNTTTSQFTYGVCAKSAWSKFSPVCAMPLYGNGVQLVVPVPKILFLFTTTSIGPGTAIKEAPSQGLLIDQAQAGARDCKVTFDINAGWNAGGARYAKVIPFRADLAKLLAEYSQSLASKAAAFALRRTEL